ncbi:TetR family transcriptional regulator [Mycobacterium sp. CBMA 234]|uniref:TetR/AcrR family transcriptional regulator n=1 Tax=Mycolicibacterium sp. CBMA 234 TaxID=1918495 RepID=UPI001391D54F|nr:TetR/AcrR family transcriptional regulator [Mycolicibacterium sp. CBMA 234]MUL67164.1 TetR family transcriptional regulator [Mycolicibacterium sp. CBMA 234]
MTTGEISDGRRVRGDATRRKVAREAAMIATTHGLDSITVGALAIATGVSKSGILTVFGNREAIQLAAVAEARNIYREEVLSKVYQATPGTSRLRALMDSWVGYLHAGVFPGGCFIAATTAEYGRRSGAVADAVRQLKRDWLTLLETELEAADSPDPAADAFTIDALLTAGNTRRELFSDDAELERARELAIRIVKQLAGGTAPLSSSAQ